VYTYNRLFHAANGKYVMIQDSDDWAHPERIAKQVAILETHDVGMCVTNSAIYTPDMSKRLYPSKPGGYILLADEEHWAPATNMFRRSVLETVKGLNPYFDRLTSMDRYFIMDIVDKYKAYYIDDHLYNIQVRTNSDHRSIDLKDPFMLRKLVITDVYHELKKQRIETGKDYLSEQNMAGLNSLENVLIKNNAYIAERLRIFACVQIDHKQYENGWKVLSYAIKKAPLHLKSYQSLLYLIKSYLTRKDKH
jgi:glycosyltransferase involved in cell wall biosynthesis